MPIFYSLIVRDNDTPLVQADLSSGNYPQITLKYLKSNKSGDGFKTFANQDYVYYMLNERPYTYLCLCEAGFSKFKCLTFLKDIREQFVRTFTDDQRGVAIAHGLSKHFETIMKDRMKYFNEASDQDSRLKALTDQLQDVQATMQANLDNISERGEKLNVLMNTTKTMRNEAVLLNTRAKRLKNQKKCENVWKKALLVLLFLLVIYFVATLACGGADLHNCL